MKLRISSDWHMYHWPCSTDEERIAFIESDVLPRMKNEKRQVLVLAGDIFEAREAASIKPICDYLRTRFKDIIYIMGNHEFYGSTWEDAFYIIQRESGGLINAPDELRNIRDQQFVCSTLWTPMLADDDLLENGINEFKFIHGCTVDKIRTAHRIGKQCLRYALDMHKYNGNRAVVVTHHLPLFECVAPKFAGHPITPAFVADVPDLIEDFYPLVWIHGHTHTALDFMHGMTRVVCNPFGNLGREYTGYDPCKVVDFEQKAPRAERG